MTVARTLLYALAVALVLAPTVAAHASKTTAGGEYRVTWGLLEEPGYAGEKNRLDLIIRENATGAGVGGLTADNLTIKLHYGEDEYDLGKLTAYRGAKGGAFAGPGNYTSEHFVYLTRPGIYVLHVEGEINGVAVDLEIPAAHEYGAMSEIMFPDEMPQSDTSALEARVAALEAEVQALKAQQQTQSSTPASVTPQATPGGAIPAAGVLLAALGVVGAALLLRRGRE